MSKYSLIIILFIGCFSTKPAPEEYENCIIFYKEEDFFRIEIKTNSDPKQYSLEIGQVYLNTTNIKNNWRLSPNKWIASVNDGVFIIDIEVGLINKLMGDKDFVVGVLLYNTNRGKEELYLN